MDEATKKALNEFVQQMVTSAQSASAWTAEQVPLLVQEWLRWQLIEAFGWAVLACAIAYFAARQFLEMRQKIRENGSSTNDGTYIYGAVTAILFLACASIGVANILTVIKVVAAPRVVVLEKFIQLVK